MENIPVRQPRQGHVHLFTSPLLYVVNESEIEWCFIFKPLASLTDNRLSRYLSLIFCALTLA